LSSVQNALYALYLARKFFLGKSSARHIAALIFGMSVSLLPLGVVQGAATGVIEGIVGRFIETGTYHIRIDLPQNYQDTHLIDTLNKIKGLRYAAYEYSNHALLSTHERKTVAYVRAISPQLWQDPAFLRYVDLKEGSMHFTNAHDVVLGEEVSKTLHVGVGDNLVLLLGSPGAIPKPVRMHVIGIISLGYRDLDRLWVFTQSPGPFGNYAIRQIGIKIVHPFSLPNPFHRILTVKRDLQTAQTLREIRQASFPFTPSTWYELEQNRYETFRGTFELLRLVMIMVFLVASVTICVSFVRIVIERKRDLAILRSLGASARIIRLTFLLSGAIVGLISAIGGLILSFSVLFSLNNIINLLDRLANIILHAYMQWNAASDIASFHLLNSEFYLPYIPIRVDFLPFFFIVFTVVLVSIIAVIFPARQASKITPVDLLSRVGV